MAKNIKKSTSFLMDQEIEMRLFGLKTKHPRRFSRSIQHAWHAINKIRGLAPAGEPFAIEFEFDGNGLVRAHLVSASGRRSSSFFESAPEAVVNLLHPCLSVFERLRKASNETN